MYTFTGGQWIRTGFVLILQFYDTHDERSIILLVQSQQLAESDESSQMHEKQLLAKSEDEMGSGIRSPNAHIYPLSTSANL